MSHRMSAIYRRSVVPGPALELDRACHGFLSEVPRHLAVDKAETGGSLRIGK